MDTCSSKQRLHYRRRPSTNFVSPGHIVAILYDSVPKERGTLPDRFALDDGGLAGHCDAGLAIADGAGEHSGLTNKGGGSDGSGGHDGSHCDGELR